MYINDLNKYTIMNVAHYDDDSTVNLIGGSYDSFIRKNNFEVGQIDNWLCANKLSLYISKSQYFMPSNIYYNNSSALQIRGQVLLHSSHTKASRHS